MTTARPERADAARNRRKILDAAARVLTTQGAASLSLDAVAKEAGVGVGTVYRRFENRARLVYELIDENETRFQAEFATHADAPPRERLRAFLHGLAELADDNRELLLLAEASVPAGRYHSGPFRRHHEQVSQLLDALAPGADSAYLADLLLMAYTPGLLDFQREHRGWSLDRVTQGLDTLVDGIAATHSPGQLPS
ncbi:TetR/AcrR family transcriptional regulator [Streptomyces apocyni]|uniref:TetR/AcrR family transcriptional regulator n=1 Tax=Streptomyces apocyni TaxID=2654677 RepID=UPI0012EAA25B|nr:TetR/AcrR family transcriptional regulator [Streptomyces apocyni]